jgi:bifunctional enzyme CysN/CysC
MDGDLDRPSRARRSRSCSRTSGLQPRRHHRLTAELPGVADQFEAVVVWMSDEPMLPGRPYWLKIGTKQVTATITEPKYKVNVNTLEHLAAKKLELNEIGICNLSLDQPIAFDPYSSAAKQGPSS